MTERNRTRNVGMAMLLGLAGLGCSTPTAPPEEQAPPPAVPGFSISFGGVNAHTVVPGEVLAIELLIHREDGFEGLIELTASDAPGIVVIFRPAEILHREDSDLLVVADQGSPRRMHQIEFTGRSAGQPLKTATLELTVVDSK